MRTQLLCAALCLVLISAPALSHHPAQGIVDEEVYEMIDGLVADTPHADLTFDDMGGGMMETTITTRTVKQMEVMLDQGLLTYISMLDGEVSVQIDFDPRGDVTMTVSQVE